MNALICDLGESLTNTLADSALSSVVGEKSGPVLLLGWFLSLALQPFLQDYDAISTRIFATKAEAWKFVADIAGRQEGLVVTYEGLYATAVCDCRTHNSGVLRDLAIFEEGRAI